jgi:hypothetical protein
VVGSVATDTFRPGASATESRATGGPAKPDARAHRSATRLFEPGGVTLEDVVLGAWDDLVADGDAECPACGGRMSMLTGCEECGSELS